MDKTISSLKWYEKNFVILLGGLTILALLALNYFLAHYLKAKNQQIIRWQLEANLETLEDRLREWNVISAGKVKVIAAANGFNPWLIEVLTKTSGTEHAQQVLDENFDTILPPLGYDGYAVFNLERKLVATSSKSYLGVPASTFPLADVLDRTLDKGQSISHPIIAIKDITGPGGAQPLGSLFQVLCSQIAPKDEPERMLGYLCLRFNPQTAFFPIFKTGLVGATGEAYAIDREGVLITPSRFPGSKNIAVQNMSTTYQVQELSARVPTGSTEKPGEFTAMASAVLKRDEESILFGYPDYRGVSVVGTGLWLDEFNFGVLVEQDHDEAFQTWFIARNVMFGLSSAAAILIIILCAVFSYNRHVLFLRERRFRSLLRNIPTPVYIKDGDGHFLAVNPEFEHFTGIHREDLLGEKTETLPMPKWQKPIFVNDTEAYSAEENKIGRLIELYSSAAEIKYYRIMRFNIASDSQMNPASVATILMDTTERILASERLSEINKRLEDLVDIRTRELKDAKERAEMASRAKAEFLANMSHEIRTPLNTILGLAHVALNTEVNDSVKSFLHKMRASGKHLLNIINDILNFSRLEVGKLALDKRKFALQEVVDSIVNLVKEKAKSKNLALNVEVDNAVPPTLIGDPLRLSQILINLCVNAVKFTEAGNVTLAIKLLGTYENKALLEFTVQDTGIGIAPEHLGELFQPFSQVDSSSARRFEGSGLGLAISKNLAELMHATIMVKSERHKGSSFTLKISLEFSNEALSNAPVPAEETLLLRKLAPLNCNMLLVEDNQLNLEVTQSLLLLMGARVESASTGMEALEKMQKRAYDIVLMDIQMPEMDGVETTRRLRQFNRELIVIATTANALQGDREWYLGNGFNAYLSKPLEPIEIHSCIMSLFQEQQNASTTPKNSTKVQTKTTSTSSHQDKNKAGKFKVLEDAGVNVQKAMTHMLDNNDLYTSGLRKFCEQREGFMAELNEFLQNNMFEHASHHVHSLTSLSAMLGLMQISDKARELEEELMRNQVNPQTVNELGRELRSAITLIRAWLSIAA